MYVRGGCTVLNTMGTACYSHKTRGLHSIINPARRVGRGLTALLPCATLVATTSSVYLKLQNDN